MGVTRSKCEVVTAPLLIESVLGENTRQTLVREEVDIPEQKPDVAQVIDFVARVEITNRTVIAGKVIFEGIITLKIVYEGDVPEQTVHVVEARINFKDFVEIPGAFPGAQVLIRSEIENVSFNVGDGDPITVTVVLSTRVKVIEPLDIEVVTDVFGPEGLVVDKELVSVIEILDSQTKQIIVEGDIDIPEQKPDVAQIIDSMVDVVITDTEVIAGKVIIRGRLDFKIIYEADVPEQTVHVVHGSVPFETFVEVPGAEPGVDVDVFPTIEHVTVTISGDGRVLEAQVVLALLVRVTDETQINIVIDVRGLDKIDITRDLVRIQEVIAEKSKQTIVSDVLEVPEPKPCVAQVIDQRITTEITDTTIIVGKIIIEGILRVKTVYEADVPEQTVHVMHHDIRFKEFIEIPGIDPTMRAVVRVVVEHVSADVKESPEPNDDERCRPVNFQAVLKLIARVVADRDLEVVIGVVCGKVDGLCEAVVTGDRVNVRTGPGLEFPVITQVNRGDRVTILAFDGNWAKIAFPDGRVGFIHRNFVRCIDQPMG